MRKSNKNGMKCKPEAITYLQLTRFQINTKSVKANMMNISTESLSLKEAMASEVIIIRIFFTIFHGNQ